MDYNYKIHVSQNYPNPFNTFTTINYYISRPENILINIYNINGKLIRILINRKHKKGSYKVIWDATNDFGKEICPGIYFYQFKIKNYSKVKKCIVY